MIRGAMAKAVCPHEHTNVPQSPATRPEDLQIPSWYTKVSSIDSSIRVPCDHQHSYPSSSFSHNDGQLPIASSNHRLMMTNSAESEIIARRINSSAPRKAYMDLTDAIALLDETCPNPDASPSATPKTPRTPLTPHLRNKRARSKSSDNSSNYSNEPLNDRSTIDDGSKVSEKRRPFLRKIGISKTEDRPFLSKIAPRIGIGKPYLERIGPSKAVERPFLEKIGPSKTVDKFTFDILRELPRAMIRRTHTIVEPMKIAKTRIDDIDECNDTNDAIFIVSEETQQNHDGAIDTDVSRQSGKGPLLKMYSFETEDLDETCSFATNIRRDSVRVASLDNVLNYGPGLLPSLEDTCEMNEHSNSKLDLNFQCSDVAQLVKCRVTTSEEIVSSNIGHLTSPPGTPIRWRRYSPHQWPGKRPSTAISGTGGSSSNFSSRELLSDDGGIVNSPTKRNISKVSPEQQLPIRNVPMKTKKSMLPRDMSASPRKSIRQNSEEPLDIGKRNKIFDQVLAIKKLEDRTASAEFIPSRSRRQTFNDAVEKFSGSDYASNKTRRQVSEDILDKSEKRKSENYCRYNERRGISSDNLRYSRETVIGSAPSASSLGYQSGGDSSFTSHRSSNNSQDVLRGTSKLLHKFELRDNSTECSTIFGTQTTTATIISSSSPSTSTTTITGNSERSKFVGMETAIDHSTEVGNKNYDITSTNSNSQVEEIKSTVKNVNNIVALSKNTINSGKNIHSSTVKSVLKKQDGMDHSNDWEADLAGSLRKPMRKIFHEPSQETMDLLTELRKVKSLLKTPSEEGKDWELDCLKPARLPKKISLSDKEFCLSMDRENSIRRPIPLKMSETEMKIGRENRGDKAFVDEQTFGPALFEKRCLSLDYADDVKPMKAEVRAISLASAEIPMASEEKKIFSTDPIIIYDSRSCLSDVFVSPTDNLNDNGDENNSPCIVNVSKKSQNNHFLEVDIAIPIDETESISPKRRVQIQGRTSDLYEIISPRSTPFRVKKRLGRISVEDAVKQESFAIGKVADGRSVVTQKKTKCFPL